MSKSKSKFFIGSVVTSTFLLMCFFVTTNTVAQENVSKPVKVFILAGQSNMEGKGSVVTTEHQLADPEKADRFSHLKKNGKWIERDDVFIDYLGNAGQRFGKLTMGYGTSRKDDVKWFGPELGFGWTIGDQFDEPVLIIKTAWGGKSIDRDFRPPSRGFPESLEQVVQQRQKRNPELTVDEYKKGYGHFYRLMMEEIKKVTADIETYVPGYQDQGFELAGFVWFQGWNDQYAPTSVEDYEENLAAFIKDVRQELNSPELPFVIGAMGHNGENQKGKIKQIADAQAAVAQRPEFQGTVVTVRTAQYWDTEAEAAFNKYWADKENRDVDMWRKFGNDRGYHYLGSPVFFYKAGQGFGEAMIDLLK